MRIRSCKKPLLIFVIFLMAFTAIAPPAHANISLFMQGLTRTVLSVFEIPMSIIEDSKQVIFPVGVLTGTVKGTFRTVFGLLGGTVQMLGGRLLMPNTRPSLSRDRFSENPELLL